MNGIRKLAQFVATQFKQANCSHVFDYRDLQSRRTPEGNVTWPCWKCGQVFSEHCGLDVLSRSDGRVIDRPDPVHKFTTITGDDWRRSIAVARARPNAVLEQIREKALGHTEGDAS